MFDELFVETTQKASWGEAVLVSRHDFQDGLEKAVTTLFDRLKTQFRPGWKVASISHALTPIEHGKFLLTVILVSQGTILESA